MSVGFAVIFKHEKGPYFYDALLSDMRVMGCDALEVHAPDRDGFEQSPELVNLIRKFGYVSIHASDFVDEQESGREVEYYGRLAREIGATAITAHPHAMQQAGWKWLRKYLGERVSFENMDWRKPYGLNPEEMRKIFEEYPDARFTYDINHVLTLDDQLRDNDEYLKLLEAQSGHYHVSGFGGDTLPHTTLHSTRQDSIVEAIKTDDPVIIESYGLGDVHDFIDEYDYVQNILRRSRSTPA